MKKLLFCLFTLPLFAASQNILPEKDGVIIYSNVVTIDSTINKNELFTRAKAWFVATYNSAKSVIQMEDKDAGIIIGKGVFDVQSGGSGLGLFIVPVRHTVSIYLKDGKYKYEIKDLSGEFGDNFRSISNKKPSGYLGKRSYEGFLVNLNNEILSTIKSLEYAMNKPITVQDF